MKTLSLFYKILVGRCTVLRNLGRVKVTHTWTVPQPCLIKEVGELL